MGLYDRPYVREDAEWSPTGTHSMVTILIVINVAIFAIEALIFQKPNSDPLDPRSPNVLIQWFGLDPNLLREPWKIYQLLTYGFLHDPTKIFHVGWNMFGLWMFGRDIEQVYGRNEFLRLYLSFIVLSGLTWLIAENIQGMGGQPLIGASGAVTAIMILYVLHFPRRLLYLWFVLPVPMWLFATFYLLIEIMGAVNQQHDAVAHVAHLAGAGFAFLYYRTGWHLGRMLPRNFSFKFRFRPRLRLHDPDRDKAKLNQQVDAILEKISREGEASLTRSERRTLEEASKRYQRRG